MKKSVLRDKCRQLAVEVIEVCRICRERKVEHALYNQLLRSGTAVGALMSEAQFAQSKADFISKLSIALKEAGETRYWLEMLQSSGKIRACEGRVSVELVVEIIKMLIASINTLKNGKPDAG